MDKRNIGFFILSLLMVAYLVVVIPMTVSKSEAAPLKKMEININDPQKIGFVSTEDIIIELDSLPGRIASLPRSSINTRSIELRLLALDKIDDAKCVILNDGTLKFDISPMTPVARVFDRTGESYYVSSTGKRIVADLRYHLDVPIVSADFDSIAQAKALLPVLDYIKVDPTANALVSAIKVDRRGDIILVPIIRGHVINFGDNSDIDNKFARLKVIYREVMPVKGWNFYDTLSVKWRGQIVATRRGRPAPPPSLEVLMRSDTLVPDADVLELEPLSDDSLIPDTIAN